MAELSHWLSDSVATGETPKNNNGSGSVPREMLVEHRIYPRRGQTVTVYGQVATEGAPPESGLVVGDTIKVVAVELVRPMLWLRRLSFRRSP